MAEMILGLPKEELFCSGHTSCSGCGPALAMRYALKAAGKNTVVVHATGCMEVVSSAYPLSAWKVPWIHGTFENAPAIASGIERAFKSKGKKVNILAIGGDGATFDIGLGALSGMIERGHKVCYICYDNEAYMNTGKQRSSASPLFANTTTTPFGKKIHGKLEPKKPLPFIVAAHGVKYVATASIANPQDFYNKVKKGLAIDGPSFIHVFAPCQFGWKFPTDKTIEITGQAIKSCVAPIYEIENGILKLNKVDNKIKIDNYLNMQGRYKHLNKEEVFQLQQFVDDRWKFLTELETKGKVFDVVQ
ncbi:MAG: pyruvate synthase subunit beta [Nanoarchaeota archaeon]|nr:pyruvate synthase subunit beta [Nanoarchaeota archaeon]MBU1444919.1 pyruvate synthase subunit beta [Nanoarchaeota archaeon]MBU2406715.1 pyruvate synthase subunit beta [Nanoarchaeota archaeon]MBU2420583.1 pyruvate synthase subunit beta [Nanoarchaeota archaeon]MBU2475588.1 pyruvate synthase subunit beta [Nanoarchaeota archaeon]